MSEEDPQELQRQLAEARGQLAEAEQQRHRAEHQEKGSSWRMKIELKAEHEKMLRDAELEMDREVSRARTESGSIRSELQATDQAQERLRGKGTAWRERKEREREHEKQLRDAAHHHEQSQREMMERLAVLEASSGLTESTEACEAVAARVEQLQQVFWAVPGDAGAGGQELLQVRRTTNDRAITTSLQAELNELLQEQKELSARVTTLSGSGDDRRLAELENQNLELEMAQLELISQKHALGQELDQVKAAQHKLEQRALKESRLRKAESEARARFKQEADQQAAEMRARLAELEEAGSLALNREKALQEAAAQLEKERVRLESEAAAKETQLRQDASAEKEKLARAAAARERRLLGEAEQALAAKERERREAGEREQELRDQGELIEKLDLAVSHRRGQSLQASQHELQRVEEQKRHQQERNSAADSTRMLSARDLHNCLCESEVQQLTDEVEQTRRGLSDQLATADLENASLKQAAIAEEQQNAAAELALMVSAKAETLNIEQRVRAAEQRVAATALRGSLLRVLLGSKASSLAQWRLNASFHHASLMLALKRMASRSLAASWNTWRDISDTRNAAEAMVGAALMRLLYVALSRALKSWHSAYEEKVASALLVRYAAMKIAHGKLAPSFGLWRLVAESRNQLETVKHEVVANKARSSTVDVGEVNEECSPSPPEADKAPEVVASKARSSTVDVAEVNEECSPSPPEADKAPEKPNSRAQVKNWGKAMGTLQLKDILYIKHSVRSLIK